MNRLPATIENVQVHGHLSLVRLNVEGVTFHSIVIDTPESSTLLRTGNEIHVLFKETETAIAKDDKLEISLQNRLKCRVDRVEKGELLAKIHLEYKQHPVMSVVTARAVRQLGLEAGSEAVIFIKTNEIMLAP